MEKKQAAEIFGPSLFNLVEDLFLIFDANYSIVDVSPSCERILGYKVEDVIPSHGMDFVHPADKQKVFSNLSTLKDNPTLVLESVIRARTKVDGFKYIRLRSTHHPHLKDHFIAVGKDVHEEYLQIQLMKNAENFAVLGSWQFDIQTGKRNWSRSLYDLLEIPYEVEITLDVAKKIYGEEGYRRISQILKEAVESHRSWDEEMIMTTYTGKSKWVRTKGAPVMDTGKVIFLEGMVQDVDHKKREEIALQDALIELNKIQQGINNHFIVSKVSPEGLFLAVNQNFEILTGYHRDEIIGKHITMLRNEFMPQEKYDLIFKEIMNNKKWRGEICHTKKNGEYYWLDITITPILDLNDRSLKELIIISYDITEKKSNDEKLRVLVERLEYVLKGIDAGIWDWVDINQKFVYWSPKTFELFGYEPGEIQPTREFVEKGIHPDDLPVIRQMFFDILKKKAPARVELRLKVKSGEYRWFQSHTFLVTDSTDRPKRLIGSLIDIDEMKRIEGELAEETRKSVQSSKLASLGEIAAGVAHEVNNPLTIIFGFTKIIEEELKSDKINMEAVAQATETIKQAASRAAKIVTGLRDFSRDGANDPFEDIRVTEILDMALTLCRERFKKNGVELKLDLRTQKFIHCRRVELSQVFLNLIMNAFDAVKSQDNPWIQVITQDVPDYLEISITDSGHGIPSEIQEKIFQPFFTTKRFGSGTGLGLSIAKNIMANHRGDIFYDPSSKHTRFVVRLPKDFIL